MFPMSSMAPLPPVDNISIQKMANGWIVAVNIYQRSPFDKNPNLQAISEQAEATAKAFKKVMNKGDIMDKITEGDNELSGTIIGPGGGVPKITDLAPMENVYVFVDFMGVLTFLKDLDKTKNDGKPN